MGVAMVEGVNEFGKLAREDGEGARGSSPKRSRPSGSGLHKLGSTPFTSLGESMSAKDSQNLAKNAVSLEGLPPEVLQNILLQTVKDDLQKNDVAGFEAAAKTITSVGLTSKSLNAHAGEVGLLDLNSTAKSARSTASEHYSNFIRASKSVLEAETDDDFDENSDDYHTKVAELGRCTANVITVTKFLSKGEQAEMLSAFCEHSHIGDMAEVMIYASDHATDFHPLPRANLLSNVIQLLPHAPTADLLDRAYENLAKAYLAGNLSRRHKDALNIVEIASLPGAKDEIRVKIQVLEIASLDRHQGAVELPRDPVIPQHELVTGANKARQSVLQKVQERSRGL